ncbi:uncharacterized protein [Aristolochia californica]|uniref:uncharacterized protein n=1 Tax=Aristolochia californica TaxID=171875 RepID=UPI0035D6BB25
MSRMGLEVVSERYWPTSVTMRDPDSIKRSDFWSELHENVMPAGGPSSLRSMQVNADSLKEVFKRTILNHEAIFRKQVYELHRLYRVQQRLMNDLRRKELQTQPLDMQRSPESSEKTADAFPIFCSSMVGLTLKDIGKTAKEYNGSYFKVQERPSVNLQLPADEYIDNSGAESISDFSKSKEFLGSKIDADANGVKLPVVDSRYSLDATRENSSPENIHLEVEAPGTFGGENCRSHGQAVIEPTFSVGTRTLQEHKPFDLNDECLEDSCSIDISANEKKSTSYKGLSIDLNEGLPGRPLFASEEPLSIFTCAAAGSSDSYERLHYGNLQASEQSPNLKKKIWTCNVGELDHIAGTSKPQRDMGNENSQHSVFGVKEKPSFEGYSSQVHFGSQGVENESGDLSLEQLNDVQHGNCQSNISSINVSNQTETHVYSSVGSTQLPQTKRPLVPRETNSEKSEEDTVSSFQPRRHVVQGTISGSSNNQLAGHGNELCPRVECTEDFVCMGKGLQSARHKHKHGNSRFSDKSRNSQPEPQVTATSLDKQEQVVETCYHAHLLEEMCSYSPLDSQQQNEQRQEGPIEIDSTVHRAAESLLHIAQENSATSVSGIADAGHVEMDSAGKCQEPQHSCDSYESIALMLTESSSQEYLSSTKPAKENVTEETTCVGVSKSRRGMRTRDFRRDVLPGLVSLSRHEICEDLHTINEVIQSSESRRNRPRKENWGMITRSRRSRVH